jgi:hypothetical protein
MGAHLNQGYRNDMYAASFVGSSAKPLDLGDEHEVIWWVDQERDESFVMSAEMQRAQ